MDVLFFLLAIVCLICLSIGYFNPKRVIKWGSEELKTRKNVFKYYGIGFLICLILFTANINHSNVEKENFVKSNITVDQSQNSEADRRVASDVAQKISALGEADSITLDKQSDVEAVRESYDELTLKQKSIVDNFTILSSAEDQIHELQISEAAVKAAEEKQEQEAKAPVTTVTPEPQTQAAPEQNNEYTVYITRTGSKYHRDGCRYLRQSCIPISKSDAINQGQSPCSVCNP